MSLGLPDKLEKYISPEPNSGCWLWVGGITANGYGNVKLFGRQWGVHRLVYSLLIRPAQRHEFVDHRCRVKCCCNPEHLEAVTVRENTLRADGPSALNARKTHCPKGHPLIPANIYAGAGKRDCAQCRRDATTRWLNKKQ